MVDFTAAIKRPFTDWKKLSIGAAAYIVPILNIILSLFVAGYLLEVAKTAKKKTLPEWKNPGNLFVRGLAVLAIALIWNVPSLIIIGIVAGSAILAYANGGSATLLISTIGIGGLFAFLILLLTMYLAPVAIIHYAHKNTFSSAFEFKKIFAKAFTSDWLVAWLLAYVWYMVILIPATIVNLLLGFTIIIPLATIGYASMIGTITSFTLMGEAYNKK
jgi:hypothetical protein